MNIRDKQMLMILIIISIIIGGICIGLSKACNNTNVNNTITTPIPSIIVNGNGSSGTGDVVTQTQTIYGETKVVEGQTKIVTQTVTKTVTEEPNIGEPNISYPDPNNGGQNP